MLRRQELDAVQRCLESVSVQWRADVGRKAGRDGSERTLPDARQEGQAEAQQLVVAQAHVVVVFAKRRCAVALLRSALLVRSVSQ